jgi:hypothetical protein
MALSIGALATAALLSAAAVHAGEYVAYPGAYPVRVMAVETASRVVLEVPVWTGFVRLFTVTLPGIVVPQDSGGEPRCERELAGRAKVFTQSFLARTSKVEVRDIMMRDTADKNARALIFTGAGSLADALEKEGFARSGSTNAKTPWCVAK